MHMHTLYPHVYTHADTMYTYAYMIVYRHVSTETPIRLIVHGPRADFRCRGVIRPESSSHVFLLPKTLNLKKKSGGYLSVVAFGSERPLTVNIYSF